tara:strand:- start:325 stop:456 length:132 start_codon:yes stop_codon:yes gene_type:complete
MENEIQLILEKVANDARNKWSSHDEEENSIGLYLEEIIQLIKL